MRPERPGIRRLLGAALQAAVLLGGVSPWGLVLGKDEPLVFGVLAVREETRTENRYRPVIEYLESAIPERDFELRVFDPDALDRALQRNEIDLLLTTPTHYEVVRSENALSGVLATQVSRYGGEETRSLGGVILARSDRADIGTLADLEGKRIASPGDCCLGGYQAPVFEAVNAGIALQESAYFNFLDNHDAVIDSVRAGKADVGFVRSGILEEMIEQGELPGDELKVINPQALGAYPYRVSTRLYPEWPLVTVAHVGAEMERRLAAALFAYQPDGEVVRTTGVAGFGPPADYLSVERLTRALGMPPFEGADQVSWRQVWEQHRVEILVLAAGAALVTLLSLALLMRHFALRRSEERFRRFFEDNASAMLLIDVDRERVADANHRAARFYGWSREELTGKPLRELWPESEGADDLARDLQAKAGVHTHCLATGEPRRVEVHATSLPARSGQRRLFVIIHDITERERAERELQRERFRLGNVIEGTDAGTWEWDIINGETRINARWAEMLGYRLGELEPLSRERWRELLHPADRRKAERLLVACLRGRTRSYDVELRLRHRSGRWVWVLLRGRVLEWTADGRPAGMWGTQLDITERKRMERDLQLAASVYVHAREAILITDLKGRIVDVNAAFTRMTGWQHAEVVGHTPGFLRSERQDDAFYRRLWQALRNEGYWSGELWNRRKDGSLFAERLTISLVRDAEGRPANYVGLATDITDLKTYQQQLEHRANHDLLTGLPNRALMADRLRQAMAESRRKGGHLAVAFLDLDGFKGVNDRHGHEMGDKLLVEVSQDFAAQLREVDTLARISGDEFVVVLGSLEDEEDAVPVIDRLVETAARKRVIDGKAVKVTASIGYTFYPQDEPVDDEDLLKQADTAMYAAKEGGRNRACRYPPDRLSDTPAASGQG